MTGSVAHGALKHTELMAEAAELKLKGHPAPECRANRRKNRRENVPDGESKKERQFSVYPPHLSLREPRCAVPLPTRDRSL